MSEKDQPFVVNDRRKFRMDGEPTHVAPVEEIKPIEEAKPVEEAKVAESKTVQFPSPAEREAAHGGPVPVNAAHTITPVPEPEEDLVAEGEGSGEPPLPPPPTAEEMEQVRVAYETTAERLDTMMRAQNLGGEHLPQMDFTQLVQSIYMSAMIQLGAGTQQGQQARVDIIGAKQSIDMLSVIDAKAGSNLAETEKRLIDAALFELRMGFLEITQLLARQAAAKQGATPGSPTGGAGGFGGGGFTGGGPRIVR